MQYYVYILTNANRNVLYTGVTNDLRRRVYEHKKHLDKGSFTARYNVEILVYYEVTSNAESAIEREKQIKGWNRKHKNKLVESKNPNWVDLYEKIL
ncbi:MAG: GIY-YIG nuclease family protein [Oscillospiraceae bacterium]|nr:GIY-YIG nuclease family protein [Oscillospiraceae bacterium]